MASDPPTLGGMYGGEPTVTLCGKCNGLLDGHYFVGMPRITKPICPECHKKWSDAQPSGLILGVTPLGHTCVIADPCSGACVDCKKPMTASHEDRIGAIEEVVKELCLDALEHSLPETLSSLMESSIKLWQEIQRLTGIVTALQENPHVKKLINEVNELHTKLDQLRHDAGLS